MLAVPILKVTYQHTLPVTFPVTESIAGMLLQENYLTSTMVQRRATSEERNILKRMTAFITVTEWMFAVICTTCTCKRNAGRALSIDLYIAYTKHALSS